MEDDNKLPGVPADDIDFYKDIKETSLDNLKIKNCSFINNLDYKFEDNALWTKIPKEQIKPTDIWIPFNTITVGTEEKHTFDLVKILKGLQALAENSEFTVEDDTFSDDVGDVINNTERFPRQTKYSKDWIGCVCRFWDDPQYKNCAKYEILVAINENEEYPFVVYSGGVDINYRYCEPITVEDTTEKGKNLVYSGSEYVTGWENGIPTNPKGK